MTTVNWERLSGEEVEELVASLILRGRAEGNRVTPSRGDRGIDLRVQVGESWEIYQIKRYPCRLTPAQSKDVEKSWNTFVAETLPALSVSAWHLVMPWDPTNQRLEWLERLTAGCGVKTDWIGRSQLDFLAAQHPQLVAYFQGDGAERLQQLITSALHGGKLPPEGASGEVLLDEVVSRQMALADSLGEVDPFYKYEVEVRSGPLTEDRLADAQAGGRGAALIVYRQISEDRHIALHIIPQDAMSLLIRPITRTVNLNTSDPEHRHMVDRFVRYGVPIEQVPAVTVRSEGPPGAHPSSAEGLISFFVPERSDLPELDLRLRAPDGRVLHTLQLDRAEVSRGFDGGGMRVAAWDASHSLHAEFLLSQSPDLPEELRISSSTLSGKPATAVIGVAAFVADISDGHTVELAIRGGPTVSSGWKTGTFQGEHRELWATVVQDLVDIQMHSPVVVRVPNQLSPAMVGEIDRTARLLRGEVLPFAPSRVGLTLLPDADVRAEPLPVRFHAPIVLELDGQHIPTDQVELVLSTRARFEVAAGTDEAGNNAYVVFETPATVQAMAASLL